MAKSQFVTFLNNPAKLLFELPYIKLLFLCNHDHALFFIQNAGRFMPVMDRRVIQSPVATGVFVPAKVTFKNLPNFDWDSAGIGKIIAGIFSFLLRTVQISTAKT